MNRPLWTDVSVGSRRQHFAKINQRELDRLSAHTSSWSHAASIPARNRYVNVFPWDKNRVKLPVISKASCDYINASYVQLPDARYIATQGPLERTAHHFWAMCYNEAVKNHEDSIVILMVTPIEESGMVKCAKYWPDKGEAVSFSEQLLQDAISIPDLVVQYEHETPYQDYTLTVMSLHSQNTVKTVYHYYYHQWADSKVPDSGHSLVYLSQSLNELKTMESLTTPIVHCSAGVGRTGTFIALDYLYQRLQYLKDSKHSYDPIFEVFKKLRDNRPMMIQTVHQYAFLYDFFEELIFGDGRHNNSSIKKD